MSNFKIIYTILLLVASIINLILTILGYNTTNALFILLGISSILWIVDLYNRKK
jgi:hypothetical protein